MGGIADERINQDKVNFEKALDELHEQWKKVENDSQEPNDDKDQGSEKTFSIEKNNSNDEYDIALEYGDSSITP